ncbi:type II toxin-antitoxin system RelE/ParE family toxin [Cocleimonas sp. KMM 6892]|uniref:type II toxin-antitoxin system RelE/ParE family toxin n=1 Tax=unclassified Cocleimonas TaxID=2639732 RepID=UPI002DB80BE1|nr:MULTISPECIES: type II toxin-antitoxin system RelE/ParE family toxin [unclassified Cocleimonas]MEB8430776.1 type II toxin-antitoxin system RelE/ParE family toxin [Cocleimonas sp. KMM 6892]MEC4714452.1 type II toxin-antitoxin system RelE/ParE family toxin [Cocleimonas sp. KMM 6895]MEC4743785.1 type II toxin-antitoxin system RelE/ParE family toxin [Cocleimonas sp. KMM 6896]
MKVRFLEVAQAELDEAFEYYESIQEGLGFRFLNELNHSKLRIIKFPKSYVRIGQFTRRCLIQSFPYSLIYQYTEDKKEILVVAVSHLHRKPDYWGTR